MYLSNNVNYPRRWYYYELHFLGENEVEKKYDVFIGIFCNLYF